MKKSLHSILIHTSFYNNKTTKSLFYCPFLSNNNSIMSSSLLNIWVCSKNMKYRYNISSFPLIFFYSNLKLRIIMMMMTNSRVTTFWVFLRRVDAVFAANIFLLLLLDILPIILASNKALNRILKNKDIMKLLIYFLRPC